MARELRKKENQTKVGTSSHSRADAGGAQSRAVAPSVKGSLESALWLVATPIGNLGDMSARARETLSQADLILAEDTRVTRKLLGLFGIEGRIERCDEEATAQGAAKALNVLANGGAVAFCSDAGMPGISDPGQRLAQAILEAGYLVRAVPGASAVLTALVVSGLPSAQFAFAGFVPPKSAARRSFLSQWAPLEVTLVVFETGPRLGASLADMAAVLGPRQACVARELTKLYEETRRGTLQDLAAHYAQIAPPKGEIVIVIAGASAQASAVSAENLDAMLLSALTEMSVKDAAASVALATGSSRKAVYARALAMSAQHKSP
jgi:16S rRNA (cytidine1402-2'-O)-methyltransferase